MRILYLHQYYCPPGGWGNNRSYDFAKAWVAAGHRVTVVTSTASYPPEHPAHKHSTYSYDDEGVRVWVLHVPYTHMMGYLARSWAFLRFMWRGLRLIAELPEHDLVYAVSTPPTVGELGRMVAVRRGIPFYFEPGDLWPDVPAGMGILRSRFIIRLLHWRAMRVYQAATRIITLSEGIRDQLLAHAIAESRLFVSPNGSNVRSFAPAQRQPQRPLRLIYAGTQGPANDVAALLHALHYLQQHQPDVAYECLIYGWGKQHTQLEQLCAALQLQHVHLHAPVPKADMPAVLQAADIGVVTFAAYPVLQANSANKYYDYLAAGLPVVINYQGWQAQHLQAHNCGLSSPQGNIPAFANNLATLLSNPELCQAMGQRARALALACYDRDKLAAEVLTLIAQTYKAS